MTAAVAVALPAGEVTIPLDVDRPADADTTMILAPGAGAGRAHPFLTGFARGMGERAVATVRFDFPYVVAGRRMPGPAAHAVAAWRAVVAHVRELGLPGEIWAAGKSYGGRMASVAAAEGAIAPAGLVYLGYPLHPPGQPAKLRASHLPAIAVPQLFVAGTEDPFLAPHEDLVAAVAACRDARVHWIEGGGHSFEMKGRRRPAEEIGHALAESVAAFLRARR